MNRNTLSRQITTTEENIRRLMNDLEDTNSGNAELAMCHDQVDRLFGKLSDSHSILNADVKDLMASLRAGRLLPDELEKLLVGEREKVSYSLKLADDAKRNLDDVMNFVQHFVVDVEKGKPIPKESFKSLYHELDTIADSMNSMTKVHRSKDIENVKQIMQMHIDESKSRPGMVSLKNILSEISREGKSRQQRKQSEIVGVNPRKSVAYIGSLAKPRSSQDFAESSGGGAGGGGMMPRLGSPDHSELMSGRRPTSPPPLRRTGTAGSIGGNPPTPGKADRGSLLLGGSGPVMLDRSGPVPLHAMEEGEADGGLSLHGRPSVLQAGKKVAKRQGKSEKRMSSAVIYSHTDDDAMSVDSAGSGSLHGSGPFTSGLPQALANFLPADPKKMKVEQGVQTDEMLMDFNQGSFDFSAAVELSHFEDSGEQGSGEQGSGEQSARADKSGKAGKKGGAGKGKAGGKKDGKAVSVVSSRRGSKGKDPATLASPQGPTPSSSPASSSFSSRQKVVKTSSSSEQQQEEHQQEEEGGDKSVDPTKEYFLSYADKQLEEGDRVEALRAEQEQEAAKLADMSPEEVRGFLDEKQRRLVVLESRLSRQEADLAATVTARVAEEVGRTLALNKQVQVQGKTKPSDKPPLAGITTGVKVLPKGVSASPRAAKGAKTLPVVDSGAGAGAGVAQGKEQASASLAVDQAGTQAQTLSQPDAAAANKKKLAAGTPASVLRKSTTSKGLKGKAAPEPLSLDSLVEKIMKFIGKADETAAEGGSKRVAIPVHNLSMAAETDSTSLNDSDCDPLKLPPINVNTGHAHSRAMATNERSKGKRPGHEGEGEGGGSHPSPLAVAGVRVQNSTSHLPPLADEDAVSVLSVNSNESQDSNAMHRMPLGMQSSELVNDIWVPPPSNLNKKMFNTICIFPLHTSNQSTSTHDLGPSGTEFLPLTLQKPTQEKDPNQQADKERGSAGGGQALFPVLRPPATLSPESSTVSGPPIVPRGFSKVEAVSRPSTRERGADGDTLVISRPLSGAAGNPSGAGPGAGRVDGEAGAGAGGSTATASLEDVTRELKAGSQAGNPLLQLYLFFYKDLDVQCRHHLLAAASGVSLDPARHSSKEGGHKGGSSYALASLQAMSDMFEVVAEEVSKLEYTTYYAMQALLQTAQTINDLIFISTSREELTDSFFFHLKEASKKLGEVKIAEAWVTMLLHDSRAIFTRTRALGIDPVLIGPQFSIAYQAFLSCQGSTLQLKKKLVEVHALVQKHLSKPLFHAEQSMPATADVIRLEQRCEQVQGRCEELEEAMEDMRDEADELRAELTAMDSQLDRTPGALLFYAVLNSPQLPEVVAQHIQVLLAVKSTLEGGEHFDFIVLKRRLETCLQGVPPLQAFFKKYSVLHKKWSAARSRMFLDRRQIGADADNHYVCPICNLDSRMAEVDIGCPVVNVAPKNSSSTGALTTINKLKGSRRAGAGKTSASPSPGGSSSHFGRF